MKNTGFSTKAIATMAILTALSFVLYMFVKFPIPVLFPSFLDIQFSDAPIIIGSYLFGIGGGILMAGVRLLLKMPFSSTAMVGEVADFLITVGFLIGSTIVYKKSASKHKFLLSVLVGSVVATLVAVVANQFILIPFYVEFFFGGNFDILLNMVRPLYADVTQENFFAFYQLLAVVPFNILRLSICSAVVVLVKRKLEGFLEI